MLGIDEGDAERVEQSRRLISTYEKAIKALRDCGAMRLAINLENKIRKERRRMRGMSNENPEVVLALARQRDEEAAAARKRRRLVYETNEQTLTASKLRRQIAVADIALKQRKQQILDVENLLESKHVMKSFSLEELGKGRSRGGGAVGKKRRFEVLDRPARIGQGLSASQKNDFAWF